MLSLSEFDELRATKQPNAAIAAAGSTSANVELDQILDLNHAPETTSGAAAEVVAAVNEGPIIAFEDSITSPKPEPPVAGKTTKDSLLWVRIYIELISPFRSALLTAR